MRPSLSRHRSSWRAGAALLVASGITLGVVIMGPGGPRAPEVAESPPSAAPLGTAEIAAQFESVRGSAGVHVDESGQLVLNVTPEGLDAARRLASRASAAGADVVVRVVAVDAEALEDALDKVTSSAASFESQGIHLKAVGISARENRLLVLVNGDQHVTERLLQDLISIPFVLETTDADKVVVPVTGSSD